MSQYTIFIPAFFQALLGFLVWIYMYTTRVREMKAKKIHPQKVADATDGKELLKAVSGPANNFINLFEIPVLFFVLTGFVYITNQADEIFLGLFSVFVALRYVHSYIQCTYNKVMHRFKVYVLGSFFMWAGWALLAYRLYA